jgi:hypothetical protein
MGCLCVGGERGFVCCVRFCVFGFGCRGVSVLSEKGGKNEAAATTAWPPFCVFPRNNIQQTQTHVLGQHVVLARQAQAKRGRAPGERDGQVEPPRRVGPRQRLGRVEGRLLLLLLPLLLPLLLERLLMLLLPPARLEAAEQLGQGGGRRGRRRPLRRRRRRRGRRRRRRRRRRGGGRDGRAAAAGQAGGRHCCRRRARRRRRGARARGLHTLPAAAHHGGVGSHQSPFSRRRGGVCVLFFFCSLSRRWCASQNKVDLMNERTNKH